MIYVTPEGIGKWVKYDDGHRSALMGRIKSFNDSVVFVVFHCDQEWNSYLNFTGQGCERKYLSFLEGEENDK